MPNMKSTLIKLLPLAIHFFMVSPTISQQDNLPKVAKLLIELEANTQWAAVTEAWKTGRSSWLANLQNTTTPLAQGLLQFESNLVPSGLEPAWVQRKAAWRAACGSAGQQPEKLAILLLELESNLLWASVLDTWASRRDGWVIECNAVAVGDTQAPKVTNNPTPPPVYPKPAANVNLPAYCTELQKLLIDINTTGLKTWAATGKTTGLWGNTSKPLKNPLGNALYISFTIATQAGTKGNTLQTTYQRYKQQLTECLQGYTLRSITLYTDLVNGNNEVWQKDGQQISLMFNIDSDINEEHYLYLQVYEKRK